MLRADDVFPVDQQVGLKAAFAAQTFFEDLGNKPGQTLRLEGATRSLANWGFAPRPDWHYIG